MCCFNRLELLPHLTWLRNPKKIRLERETFDRYSNKNTLRCALKPYLVISVHFKEQVVIEEGVLGQSILETHLEIKNYN